MSPASERPAFQLRDGLLEGLSLLVATRFGPELLIGPNRQVERQRVVLGAGKARRVVRERRARELIGGKLGRHPLPPRYPLSRVGLTQGPQMPRPAIIRVGGDSPPRGRSQHLRAPGSVATKGWQDH